MESYRRDPFFANIKDWTQSLPGSEPQSRRIFSDIRLSPLPYSTVDVDQNYVMPMGIACCISSWYAYLLMVRFYDSHIWMICWVTDVLLETTNQFGGTGMSIYAYYLWHWASQDIVSGMLRSHSSLWRRQFSFAAIVSTANQPLIEGFFHPPTTP